MVLSTSKSVVRKKRVAGLAVGVGMDDNMAITRTMGSYGMHNIMYSTMGYLQLVPGQAMMLAR